MPPHAVPSLKESCIRVLSAHIGAVNDVGHCPYRLVKSVLVSCTADQLAEIEANSPHIAQETSHLWRVHLERDYPLFDTSGHPEDCDPKSLYFLARSERAAALSSAAQRLRERTQQSREEKGKRKAVFSHAPIVAAPRKKVKKAGGPASASLFERAMMQTKKLARIAHTGPGVVARPDPSPAAGQPLFSDRLTAGSSKDLAQPIDSAPPPRLKIIRTTPKSVVRPVIPRPPSTASSSSSSTARSGPVPSSVTVPPARPPPPRSDAMPLPGPKPSSLFMPKRPQVRPTSIVQPTGMRPGVQAFRRS